MHFPKSNIEQITTLTAVVQKKSGDTEDLQIYNRFTNLPSLK